MTERHRGRPRAFDRDRAVLDAARLFWRRGYSGTSTRTLTAALGLSTSSLYAAFGSKAGLFEEAVRTYAERYREIYQLAVAEKDIQTVIERILTDSVHEFTQPSDTHPGCLISSAVMTDSTSTLDTSAYIAELHGSNEQALLVRVERAIQDGELAAGTDAAVLTGLVQSVWHGLSVRSNLDTAREDLLATAHLVHQLMCRQLTSTGPKAPTVRSGSREGTRK
ncbi:TetR/AcrR family transcriptional regulator [Streptomyces mangrovisoli]|uniref:TetR family transcriptional regulator n=1 Tax=Streptomyces mangrovisoli TaxID=1428628 RepID=A0A1J4P0R2_9ACTN|nr:TetR/AcrR family transcriptional regulator [Streptomyces mangrovisoli]OIJ68335.1 TetR family transcriptional regulator [Streptomyces mangrovisoli]